ncbi:single-stranded DNA-binding protein [Rothia nasimurium]|uniref:single-stranded DNA-binding protein n=1 Tax=Rothia nasimurium TaxID=85336 RepID=UPI001F41883D|nr:single-stranded DNA-binding protein [Rothia nasimurium]
MANDTTITITGNLTADPELRFTPNGAAVTNFTIASTPRVYDRATNEWREGETLFLRARIWREAAENVAATLKKGMRVIAQGKLKAHSYETKEGERRTGYELEVEEVGPSLRFASAQVLLNPRGYVQSAPPVQQGGGAGATSQLSAQPQGQAPERGAPQADPWAQQAQGNYDWGQGAGEEVPF